MTALDAVADQLALLVERVSQLEDRLAIYQLVASYGPAVDSESPERVAALWAPDGVYDPGGMKAFCGRDAVGGLVRTDLHQQYLRAGCAHVLSLPQVELHGETAVAVNHSRVYVRDGDHWRLARVSANRWELCKTGGAWQVELRTNRLLDGDPRARAVLDPGAAGG